jgi:FkbM family methyltransferase
VFARQRFLWRAWRYRLRSEPAEIRFVRASLRSGDCAVDIGAHKGAYLYWMHRAVGPSGAVFAFEPQPVLAHYLEERARDLGSRVTVENLALSDANGTATLEVPAGGPACGATLEPGLRGAKTSVEVAVRTLDNYFSTRPEVRIAFIKCDVEGHELRVFRGAEHVLRTHRPVLLFECELRHNRRQSMSDVFGFLQGLGYRGSFFLGSKCLPLEDFRETLQADPHSTSYANNFVFVSGPHQPERSQRDSSPVGSE